MQTPYVGNGTVPPFRESKKKMKNAMEQTTAFKLRPEDYRNRNGILLHPEDYDLATIRSEAKNTLYYWFSKAHGTFITSRRIDAAHGGTANISNRWPSELPPAWEAMSAGKLIDKDKYFPPGLKFQDPRKMSLDNCMKVIHHILSIGEIEFHHWQAKNGDPQLPVPFEERFWAANRSDPEALALQQQREQALNARPTHFARNLAGEVELDDTEEMVTEEAAGDAAAGDAGAGLHGGVPQAVSLSAVTRPAGRAAGYSPYGSAMAHAVHDLEYFTCPEELAFIADPHDLLPPGVSENDVNSPYAVPATPEARAQWSFAILTWNTWEEHFPVPALKTCITILVELPVRAYIVLGALELILNQLVRNHHYEAKNFYSLEPRLPTQLTWDACSLAHITDVTAFTALEAFLRGSPWQLPRIKSAVFGGVEITWLFVLGCFLYIESPCHGSTAQPITYNEFKTIMHSLRSFLRQLEKNYAYPGIGPCAKYGVASSRLAYLYRLWQYDEDWLDLLKVVQRLVSSG